MKLVDTDAQGKVVFKSKRNSYFTLLPDELESAQTEIQRAIEHLAEGKPRLVVDKRKY